MRKINKTTVISENIFEANNGKVFPYEGLALEEDLRCCETKLNMLDNIPIDTPQLNLCGRAYKVKSDKDLKAVLEYCQLKDFSTEGFDSPMTVIITDTMALSVNSLVDGLKGLIQ